MTYRGCGKKTKKGKHTPITSKKQRGLMGADLARKRAGKKTRTGMSEAQLKAHLKESKGKNLPARAKPKMSRKKVARKSKARKKSRK